jgi:hypothetical protein
VAVLVEVAGEDGAGEEVEGLAVGLALALGEAALAALEVLPGSAWLTRAATIKVAPAAPRALRLVHRRRVWRP